MTFKEDSFVPQDGHDYVSEVSVAGCPAVQRGQDGPERSAATETSGGELCWSLQVLSEVWFQS